MKNVTRFVLQGMGLTMMIALSACDQKGEARPGAPLGLTSKSNKKVRTGAGPGWIADEGNVDDSEDGDSEDGSSEEVGSNGANGSEDGRSESGGGTSDGGTDIGGGGDHHDFNHDGGGPEANDQMRSRQPERAQKKGRIVWEGNQRERVESCQLMEPITLSREPTEGALDFDQVQLAEGKGLSMELTLFHHPSSGVIGYRLVDPANGAVVSLNEKVDGSPAVQQSVEMESGGIVRVTSLDQRTDHSLVYTFRGRTLLSVELKMGGFPVCVKSMRLRPAP